ncbi:SC6A9 protein, partial [Acromyrmex charruanus]
MRMNHDPTICHQYFYCSQRRHRVSSRICERQRDGNRHNDRSEDDDEDENPLGKWPHALSSTFACLGCTLGLFNISRFAILSIQFGANFMIQFLILSLILGIPLLTLQVCLGQRLAAGSVDMWSISPICQGVGIALLVAQAFIGVYSIVGVSWMFVFFRDSFITKQDKYRWAEPFLLYREDNRFTHNITASYKLYETVPDYFSGAVLQRHHLVDPNPGVVTLKFQVAFNLAVVWMIVFVSLSKGLRSYGKVVYVFTLAPVFGTLVLCAKLIGLIPPGSFQFFPATVWSEFFINGKSWVAASNEVFLTWGLLGAAAMQIAAHNKHKHLLQRDISLVVIMTFVVLFLVAFLANTCAQILRLHGYIYTTSSFERISVYSFMRLANDPAPSGYSITPERFMSHASFLLGQRVIRPGVDTSIESGYQVLRLATELVPSTLALLGTEQVSPFWAVLFYFILILFGIAQQLAIWHCVITGIMAINTKMMKLWETTITFFSCACGYILGLPMATESVQSFIPENCYQHFILVRSGILVSHRASVLKRKMSNNVHSAVRRSVPCYFCNEFLEEKYLTEHITHCAAVLEECPNKCGVYVPRRNLEVHEKICIKGTSMKNSQIKDIQDSVWKEKVFSILTLLRLAIDQGEKERIRLQDDLSRNLSLLHSQQESFAALQLNIEEAVKEFRSNHTALNRRLNTLEMITDDIQHCTTLNLRQISEQLKLLEGELTDEQGKHVCTPNDWFQELKDVKTFVAKESVRASDIWQENSQRINDLKLELEMRCKNMKEIISKHDTLSEKVNSLSEEICKHVESVAKRKLEIKGLKFQMKENLKYIEELIAENCRPEPSLSSCSCEGVESASTNGHIIWRIDRYKEKMNEAKESDRALYSPIFHNKEYGYTLRMELFLNGRGQWKDRHIIGCLRVENGKWDPLLDWPCILRAVVNLRDQDNPANDVRKIVKTVGRDKDVSNPDKESGLYMFIPHTILSRYSGYTKNNIIFLDIQLGIYVVYYLDYTVGGAWWIIFLYLIQIVALFAIRGRPHSGEAVVAELFPPSGRYLKYWAAPLLSFTWTVVLPLTLMALSIIVFKSGNFWELYSYRRTSKDYWVVWARQLGTAIQLIPILIIPVVSAIQACRYLNNGPPDIFDSEQVAVTINHCEQCNGRIQLLCRPMDPEDPRDAQTQIGNVTSTSLHGNGILPIATTEIPFEDPPPKYTPPPSYTTATGARIAKMLRQSFRRSVRRIANVLGESSAPRQRPALQPPPPDYATVLVEMNQSGVPMSRDHVAIHVLSEPRPDVTNTGDSRHGMDVSAIEHRHRPNTIDRASKIGIASRSRTIERTHSTIDRSRRSCANATTNTLSSSNLTAADVANLLRSSIRRGTARTQHSLRRSFCHEAPTTAASVENLVEAAAPIGEDSLILSKDMPLVPDEQVGDRNRCDGDDHDDDNDGEEKKTASEMENSVSVI